MKSFCRRTLACILAMLTVLSLVPLRINANSEGISGAPTSVIPEITITPIYKNGTKGDSTTSSYVNSVILNAKNEPNAESFAKATLKAKVMDGNKNKLTGYTVYFIKIFDKDLLTKDAPAKSLIEEEGGTPYSSEANLPTIEFKAPDPDASLSNQIHYFGLFVYDKEEKFVAKTISSISISYFHEKTSNISWERVGMQIRTVNDVPIGKYVYKDGTYKAKLDPKSDEDYNFNALKDVPYFYLKWSKSGPTQLGQTYGFENINELYEWLKEYVAEPYKEITGQTLNGVVSLGGPSMLLGKNNSQGNVLYVDAYYSNTAKTVTGEGTNAYPSIGMVQPGKSNKDWTQNINTYAGWGDNSKEDFKAAAYITTTVNVKIPSDVQVICYDEDKYLADPSVKPLYETSVTLPEMIQTPNVDYLGSLSNGLLVHFGDAIINDPWVMSNLNNSDSVEKMSEYMYMNIGKLVELYSTVQYDAASRSLVSKKKSDVIDTALNMYNVRKNAIDAAKADPNISGYIGATTIDPNSSEYINAKELKGYKFDFGFGLDMLSSDALHLGAAVSSSSATEKQALNVIYCSTNGEKTVYLFYKAVPVEYTVKYRIDKKIDESLTQKFAAPVGTVINKGDFPVRELPESVTIIDYENVPLTITEDPEKNVIIVDAITGTPSEYTVKYVIDGHIDESMTEEYMAAVGDVITKDDVKIKPLPKGTTVENIENVPLTVVEDPEKNIIYVIVSSDIPYVVEYYKKTELYKSENKIGKRGDMAEVDFTPPSGYTFDHTDNYPMELTKPNQVVRVYFVPANNVATPAKGASNLYSDDTYSIKAIVGSIKSGYGVYGMFEVDYSDFYSGNSIKKITHKVPESSCDHGVGRSENTHSVDLYRNIKITATATFLDYYYNGTAYPNGRSRTVNMVVKGTTNTTYSAQKTELKHVATFVFPKNPIGNGKNLPKAYIPINWKDRSYWEVAFNATISYEKDEYKIIEHNGRHSYDCSRDECKGHTCRYSWYTCNHSYINQTKTVSSKASAYVKDSMYEDDFTGRGRR